MTVEEVLASIDADLKEINKTLKKMVRKPYKRKPLRTYQFSSKRKI